MKKKRKKKVIGVILIVIFVFIVASVVLLLVDNPPEISLLKEKKEYLIPDECGVVAGNLIHNIKDEGECRIKCRNECGLRQEKFHSSEFIKRDNTCHLCRCYCK